MQASWLEGWGLWAVLLGAVLEGETVLIAAGYAASQGYIPILPTLAVAVGGATLGDHLFYLLGRYWGAQLFRHLPALRTLRGRAERSLERWGRLTAFATRFAYGLRAVLPATMGAVRFPLVVFSSFNVLGATAFAAVYLSLGYFFGEAMEELVGRARSRQMEVLIGIAAVGALLWIVREWRLFHPRPGESGPESSEGETASIEPDDAR